jgi:hypothetical protein
MVALGKLQSELVLRLLLGVSDETATPPDGGVSGTTGSSISGRETYILPGSYSNQRRGLGANAVDHT